MSEVPRCYSYVRFSTPEQLKGDSLRRQLELSKQYAETHGLILDESIQFRDLGLSAYHGINRVKGALGKFLELVKTGEIPRGSVLLVESLDRLSRQEVLEALNLFLNLVRAGIKIVTLADGISYDKDSINANVANLIISLTIMARAHEESKLKGQRLKASWKHKRSEARKTLKPLTSNVPAWLHFDKATGRIETIKSRVDLVRQIFQMSVDGGGIFTITKFLNETKVPPWSKGSKGWHFSRVTRILKSRAVLGEFQPGVKIDDKWQPIGQPIPNYFPRVIEDDLFYRVQKGLKRRRTFKGKTGSLNSLFAGIARCGYCGGSMSYVNKSDKYLYLACDNSRRGRGCRYISIGYNEFEDAFMDFCDQLDVEALLANDIKGKADKVRAQLAALEGRFDDLKHRIENLIISIETALSKEVITALTGRVNALTEEMKQLEIDISNKKAELSGLGGQGKSLELHLSNIHNLKEKLSSVEGKELFDIRFKLREQIRILIDRIDIFPNGLNDRVLSWDMESVKYEKAGDVFGTNYFDVVGYDPDHFPSKKAYEKARAEAHKNLTDYVQKNTGKKHRLFVIRFKNGACRVLRWEGDKYRLDSEKTSAGQLMFDGQPLINLLKSLH